MKTLMTRPEKNWRSILKKALSKHVNNTNNDFTKTNIKNTEFYI